MGAAMSTKSRAHLDQDGYITAFDVEVTSVPHSSRPGTGGTPNLRSAVLIKNSKLPAKSPDVPAMREVELKEMPYRLMILAQFG